ncbi:MAG TPA: RsmE family RNA methyltransferase [Opitutaceae bacterium]|nr:RsmE family RNA methyltransferase [Opitutaceae bacterium]
MNLILFERDEIERPLRREDVRAAHLLEVLRRKEGETFDAGLVDGPRGKGTVAAIGREAITLRFAWGAEPPPLDPIILIVGLPRPQTARKLLQEAASLGVRAIHFVSTEKGEPGYAHSTLWRQGEWRRHLVAGAEQAFDTRLPSVSHGRPLAAVLDGLEEDGLRVALDNYESPQALGACPLPKNPAGAALALGPERGWSAAERDLLRARRFTFAHLGPRVLRAETAAVAALAILKSRLGWI